MYEWYKAQGNEIINFGGQEVKDHKMSKLNLEADRGTIFNPFSRVGFLAIFLYSAS